MSHPAKTTSLGGSKPFWICAASSRSYSRARCLLGRQALQANPHQRIIRQLFAGNRTLAHFANAEGAVVNAMQRAVHFIQQAQHLVALVLGQHVGQPRASRQQLLADAVDVNRFTNRHG